MIKSFYVLVIFHAIGAFTSYVQAVSFGSDGMITSVPNNFQFPAVPETENVIAPCGVAKGGFSLEDSTTVCSFSSLFPVSGDIDLNGGTLILYSDFYFDNKPSSFSAGTVIGNGNTLSFSPRTTMLAQEGDETVLQNVEISFSTDITLHGTWRFSGATNVLNGQGCTITLGNDATLIIEEGTNLTLENTNLVGLAQGKLSCNTDNAQLTLHNTTLVLSDDYSFKNGSLSVIKDCHVQGPYTFVYESVMSSTLTSAASLSIDTGTTFKYDPVSHDQTLLVFEDRTSRLCLSDGRLHAGVGGIVLKSGSMHVSGFSYLTSDSLVEIQYVPYNFYLPDDMEITYTATTEQITVTNNGILFGTGNAPDDFACCIYQGATLLLESDSVLSYSNSDQNLITCDAAYSLLKIGCDSALKVYNSLSTSGVFITFGKDAYLSKSDTAEFLAPITFQYAFLRRRLP